MFADSGYWIALLNPRDTRHDEAHALRARYDSALVVTSEMVLAEVMNHLSGKGEFLRQAARLFVENLCANARCRIVPQTTGQFHDAVRLYGERSDKEWSLTDCASMQIMWERGIRDALTFDRHFEQAGFTTLLVHRL